MSESSGGEDNNDVALDRLHLSCSSSPPPPPPPPPLCALRAHGGDVQAAVLSPCGSLLYTGDSEGHLRIWDVEDRRTAFSLQLHPSEGGVLGLFLLTPPHSSSSSSSARRRTRELLSQGREGTLKLWRLSDSGREIVAGGGDAAAGRPSSSSGDPGSPPPPPPPPPQSPPRPIKTTATGSKGFCVLSAVVEAEEEEGGGRGGRLLAAVASEDAASVRVFDARRAELLCELSEAEAAAAAPASSSSGAAEGRGQGKSRGMAMAVSLFSVGTSLHALVGYEDGSVVLWRCLEGGARRKGKKKSDGGDDDGDGSAGAAASASAPPRALSSLRIHFDAVTAVVAAASQDPRGKKKSPLRFFSGGADSVLASYLVEVSAPCSSPSLSCSYSLSLSPGPAAKLPARGVGALAVLQRSEDDGTALVVAGGWDGAIRLLGLREEEEEKGQGEDDDETSPPCSSPPPPPSFSLEPLGELEHHVAPIAALTFDASGELLASGGRDGSVALWGGLGGLA